MNYAAAALELRREELTRLSACVPPSLATMRSMTPAPFRTAVAMMLERLGYEIVNQPTAHDLITTKDGRKIIVTCAEPAQIEPTGTPALNRLHEVVIAQGADFGFYVTARAFTQQARDFAKTAPVKLVDGADLEKSMKRSLADVRLPITYDALCCECGDRVKHRLDQAEALPCGKGHAVAPTIASAALQPKEYPVEPRKGATPPNPKVLKALQAKLQQAYQARG